MSENNCLAYIKSLYPSLFEVEKKIADFILAHPDTIIYMTVEQVAKSIGVAKSSIIRFCQKIGFNGFTQLKINIAKNIQKYEEPIPSDIEMGDDPLTVTKKIFTYSSQALKDTLEVLDAKELSRAVDAIATAKRLEFYGIGTSAPIALDAYYRFMRIGYPAYVATDPFISSVSASMLDSKCVAIGISHSGRTADIINALKIAKNKGATTICITGFAGSPITQIADIHLITSTGETRFRKEATASRIAQIALLDSLHACAVLRKYDRSISKMQEVAEILEQIRN
ncbi:MurR/RpiR family transcriptional regulator [Caldicoprobacter algeriensis]|uniref:MurR/RpiR family transcriptional regulator n=1 Tax=Caldicoprobacter algeriensis TaxID=699281 RepID=UPI00207A84BD|nr:MurR/RpiR family transcriptional regulator [Caldicoprobacter algeriensis]MCM8901782.1 MurR/RpiR family transcriptional regulator [Caldicoprobacter algeriensis]